MKLFRRLLTAALVIESLGSGHGAYAAATSDTSLIGFMRRDDSWLDVLEPIALYGFYQFQADGQGGFRAISPVGPDNQWALNGGTYANGKYYCYSLGEHDAWNGYTLTYRVIDGVTWKTENVCSYSYPWKSEETMPVFMETRQVPSSIVYDAIEDKFYTFSHRMGGDGDTQFSTIDPQTGVMTKISDIRYITSATCDGTGSILAIDMNGNLGRVDKAGKWTDIGHTGFFPTRDSAINLGAAIDYRTGILYWSFYGFANERDRNYNENPVFALLEIDPLTGAAKVSYNYPINNQLSALTIQNSHPAAPDNIFDLEIRPEADLSQTGVITFTVPSVTYAQQPLNGPLTLTMAVDGEMLPAETVTAGSKYEKKIEGLSNGIHTVTAKLEGNGHATSEAFSSYFFGKDVPSAVTDLTLKNEAGTNKVTLTWTVPTTGKNGGAVDTKDLRYRIVRYPDQKTVARSAKGTSFSEELNVPFSNYYYRVYPYYSSDPSIEGPSATSNRLPLGLSLEIPWSENFNTPSSINTFTLIDANEDGSSEWNSPCWKYDSDYYCAFYYGNRDVIADDWLITPPLNMSPEKLYKLTYKYYAFYGYGSHLQVSIGNSPTVEGMNNLLLDKEFISSFSDYPGKTETIIFCPKDGESFIGFHHISETMEHLSIDDISIEEYADANVPAALTDLAAVNSGAGQATLTFTLPTLTAGGKNLSGNLTVKIYKGDDLKEAAATLTGLKPGDKTTWVDNYASAGVNIYTVIISNDKGDGLSSTVSIDLTAGLPVQLKAVYARAINSNQVEVSWNPADVANDANGNPIDPASIRYLVYKPMADVDGVYPMLIARDLDTNIFIDNNPFAGLSSDQQLLNYYVAAVNDADEGPAQASDGVFIGDAYTLPFSETWLEQQVSTNPWFYVIRNGATWYPRAIGYDPRINAHDGYGLFDCEVDYEIKSGTAAIATPRIDLTSKDEPVLKYWLYRDPMYDEDVKMTIGIDNGNRMMTIPNTVVSAKSSIADWEEITVSLADYADLTYASIIFIADVKADQTIHLDQVSIDGKKADKEVRLVSFKTPAECRAGEEVNFLATVENIGSSDASSIEVKLIANDRTVDSKTVASLASGKKTNVQFAWTPEESGEYATEVVVSSADDTKAVNNSMKGVYNVKKVVHPYITKISGQLLEEGVKVSWHHPDAAEENEIVTEDVELFDSFTISDAGGWSFFDGDGRYTFNFSDGNGGVLSWPNYQELQAYIVFNPGQVKAASMPFTPYSGEQAFVSWAAAGGDNNDWLISPELPGNSQLISFVARSAVNGTEPFKVLYSTEGTEVSDFHSVGGDVANYANEGWRMYHYLLPEGTKHFAINYLGGSKAIGLVIDDIMFYGSPVTARPDGYNIYRDGQRLNSALLTDRNFLDTEAEEAGTYRYRVAPVYNGTESRLSDEFVYEHSGVGSTVAAAIKVSAAKGSIVIEGAEGYDVSVATAAGQVVFTGEGSEKMDIRVVEGVYVVRVGREAYKLIVK